MTREGIDGRWIRSIDGKLTFCGVLEEHYEDCAKYWRKEETRKNYDRDYDDKIIPNLSGHDEKTVDAYTKEDYEAAISAIAEQGQGKKGEAFVPYADSTIQHYRHLIEVVVSAASEHELCDNVLWGSRFSLTEHTPEDEIKERVKLKKSLSISQELAVADMLLSDVAQRGQEMGLLLMFALGLRNGEACGANYGDIRPMRLHPECKVLWVYKSTAAGTNIVQSSGKTRNADRIIPIPDVLERFIVERRKYLEKNVMFSKDDVVQNIDELPIVCVGNDYFHRCSSNQLTAAGREMFKKINMTKDQLAYIDFELSDESLADELKERDPTAYLLRRNFGTHLHIVGADEAEIEFLIGHDIDDAYETRNEFVNEEKLFEIKQKLDQRPILNTSYLTEEPQVIAYEDNQPYTLYGNIPKKYQLALHQNTVKVQVTAKEPLDPITITLKVSETAAIRKMVFPHSVQVKPGRTINILKKYHELYSRRAK